MTKHLQRWLILSLTFLLVGCADPEKEGPSHNNEPLPPGEWIETSPDPSPSARILHAMVYDTDNQQVIFFGGKDAAGASNDTWVYTPSDNTWTQKMNPQESPPPREGHAMVYDELKNRVILFGGKDIFGFLLNDTWIYDVAENRWTRLTLDSSPSERWLTVMVYDPDTQQAVLFGGETNAGLDDETWIFDLQNDNWMNKTPLMPPSARFGHTMAYDINSKKVILYGGETSLTSRIRSSETWAYDVLNNSWTSLKPANHPLPRSKHAMVYDAAKRQVLMFGGFSEGSSSPNGETWVYDYLTNQWSKLSPPFPTPQVRFLHAMVYDADTGETILFGGADQGCGEDINCEAPLDSFLKDTWHYIPGQ